ncbi:hypothetical protein [Gallaecimonas pentaromativorans]|uniref:hypothetical protein n=1 Tax=Gallaecimonas pentaromativorans TaxID=584787 RepID=UPI003A957014
MYYYVLCLHLVAALLVAGALLLLVLALLPLGFKRGQWQPLADFSLAFDTLAWPALLLLAGSGAALGVLDAPDLRVVGGGFVALKGALCAVLALLWWGWRYRLLTGLGKGAVARFIAYLGLMALLALVLALLGTLHGNGFFSPDRHVL